MAGVLLKEQFTKFLLILGTYPGFRVWWVQGQTELCDFGIRVRDEPPKSLYWVLFLHGPLMPSFLGWALLAMALAWWATLVPPWWLPQALSYPTQTQSEIQPHQSGPALQSLLKQQQKNSPGFPVMLVCIVGEGGSGEGAKDTCRNWVLWHLTATNLDLHFLINKWASCSAPLLSEMEEKALAVKK